MTSTTNNRANRSVSEDALRHHQTRGSGAPHAQRPMSNIPALAPRRRRAFSPRPLLTCLADQTRAHTLKPYRTLHDETDKIRTTTRCGKLPSNSPPSTENWIKHVLPWSSFSERSHIDAVAFETGTPEGRHAHRSTPDQKSMIAAIYPNSLHSGNCFPWKEHDSLNSTRVISPCDESLALRTPGCLPPLQLALPHGSIWIVARRRESTNRRLPHPVIQEKHRGGEHDTRNDRDQR